jgi:hypothetical protein
LYVPFSNFDRECESLPRSAGGRPSVFLRHTSITWTAQPDTAERPTGEELTCPGESFQAVKDQAFRAICYQGLRHQKRAKHRYRMDPARPCQDREWSDHTEERRGREVQNVGRPPQDPISTKNSQLISCHRSREEQPGDVCRHQDPLIPSRLSAEYAPAMPAGESKHRSYLPSKGQTLPKIRRKPDAEAIEWAKRARSDSSREYLVNTLRRAPV